MTGPSDAGRPDGEGADPAACSGPAASVADRAARLDQAVRAAGGNKAVAAWSGIPERTLDRYLAGRDMTASALVALARATGVSVEWLATGDGPGQRAQALAALLAEAEPGAAEAGISFPEDDSAPSVGLAWNVNPNRIARAYQMALEGLVGLPGSPPDARRLMQVTLLLYDHLAEAEQAAAKPPAPAP